MAKYNCHLENCCFKDLKNNGIISPDKRRLDIIVTGALGDENNSITTTLLDITCPNAVTRNLNPTNASVYGRVAELAAHSKHVKYDSAVAEYNLNHPNRRLTFYPIAIEVQGKFCEETNKIFNKIIQKISIKSPHNAPLIANWWHRKISISLQKNVASQILAGISKLTARSTNFSDETFNNSLNFYHNSFQHNNSLNNNPTSFKLQSRHNRPHSS